MVGVEKVSSICNYISPFKTRETNDELWVHVKFLWVFEGW
jgi:hypothetical protein